MDTVCKNGAKGYTSIYADIRDGRKSEVDTISGSVAEAAHVGRAEPSGHVDAVAYLGDVLALLIRILQRRAR